MDIAITGSQQSPNKITTNAYGSFSGMYNKKKKILTYTISFHGIAPTAMHFHKGEAGVAGPVEIPITVNTNPVAGSTAALTNEQEKDLLAGHWYINIHSNANPGGEIRGQLIQSN
jgi:hypothetical protein